MWHVFFTRGVQLSAGVGCPSVCQSVTLVNCIQMAYDITNFFLDKIAPSFYTLNPSAVMQLQGEPPQRKRLNSRVGKICDFQLKSPFISETVRDRTMVAVER